jgi:hypothetical protein
LEIKTFTHRQPEGWSVSRFPEMDSDHTLVTVFGGSDCIDEPERVAELMAAYPRAHVIGCSTSGEIFETSIDDGSLSVAVCRFDGTTLRSTTAPVRSGADSREAGRQVGRALVDPALRSILVVCDGINVNGSELLEGLNAVLPESVVVTGGLAGDGDRFKRTWVIHQRVPSSGFVAAVGFYGDRIHVGHGSKGGWDLFGPERRITRSVGNVLHEIDGKPALALYKEYLGERASGLPGTALLFPLALRASRGEEKSLVRTILSVDEASQSMTFAGDVPQGSLVRLMRANFDRLIEGASEAARLTSAGNGSGGDSLAIAISCVGRRLVLGQRAEEEVEAVKEALPAGAHLVGFYSYGEISPFATGRCDLHNQTMTLTHIEER